MLGQYNPRRLDNKLNTFEQIEELKGADGFLQANWIEYICNFLLFLQEGIKILGLPEQIAQGRILQRKRLLDNTLKV